MSGLSEKRNSVSLDPSNYAPRWSREKREKRPSIAVIESLEKSEVKPDSSGPNFGRTPAPDQQLENAVFESLRRSLDPQIMPEPPGFFERSADRRLVVWGTGIALATGASVAVALLIANAMPAIRQPSDSSQPASMLAHSTPANSTVASPAGRRTEDESKPALAQFKGLPATSGDASKSSAPRHSGQLLRQFLDWQEKASRTIDPNRSIP